MNKLFFPLLVLLFCSTSAPAQKIQFVEYELPNGLKVFLHEDHSTPIVAVTVMYHVGSKNEKPQRTGFAHFFEHLLFEGTENIKRGEFDSYIKNAGGFANANTTFDRTFYYEKLPSHQLALGLWLESERMLHARVDKTGVETQRQVVKEERRSRYDNQPYGRLLEEAVKRIFSVHPYKYTPIGSLEDINAATEQDFVDFYREFYRPDNAILSIAGDIDIEQTRKLVDLYFRDIPRGKGEIYRPKIVEPRIAGELRDTVYDNVQLPAVLFGYQTPARGTPDFYPMKMLTMLLSKGGSSRLNTRLVDEQQKATEVGAIAFALEDPAPCVLYSIASKNVDGRELETAMDAVISSVQQELISEKEFQKLQNQVENDLISANNNVAGIAENIANYEMFYGDAHLINNELNRFRQVTREDILRVAKKYLSSDARIVLYWLPKGKQP